MHHKFPCKYYSAMSTYTTTTSNCLPHHPYGGLREAKEECQEERILVNGGHGQKTTAADIDEFYE
jgi:hypothetical protein